MYLLAGATLKESSERPRIRLLAILSFCNIFLIVPTLTLGSFHTPLHVQCLNQVLWFT
ncbi:hypothetical protein BDW72DRAFT_186889 [Aspergillus terricola var. indicus]